MILEWSVHVYIIIYVGFCILVLDAFYKAIISEIEIKPKLFSYSTKCVLVLTV
jgi:hypothetical protein